MNPETQELISKYPTLFKENPRCGAYVSKGWKTLIEKLCNVLEHHIVALPNEERKEMYCVQIKEKFGGLRFYMNRSDDFVEGAIALAETMSYTLCEECGGIGQRRSGDYIQVLCDQHAEEKSKKGK